MATTHLTRKSASKPSGRAIAGAGESMTEPGAQSEASVAAALLERIMRDLTVEEALVAQLLKRHGL